MKARSTFFVVDRKLYTRKEGKTVEVWKWLRRYKGEPVTSVYPHVWYNRLVLLASNSVIGDFLIYKNGDVKEELFPDEKEYAYELIVRKPPTKKKGPP